MPVKRMEPAKAVDIKQASFAARMAAIKVHELISSLFPDATKVYYIVPADEVSVIEPLPDGCIDEHVFNEPEVPKSAGIFPIPEAPGKYRAVEVKDDEGKSRSQLRRESVMRGETMWEPE